MKTAAPLPPASDIPGLLRVTRLRAVGQRHLAGEPVTRIVDNRFLLVRFDKHEWLTWRNRDLEIVGTLELDALRHAHDAVLSGDLSHLALVDDRCIRLFDTGGKPLWSLALDPTLNANASEPQACCHFNHDGSLLWVLLHTGQYLERGDLLLLVDAQRGVVLDRHEIRLAFDAGPAWWLCGPHPRDDAIYLEGGMGQDGCLSVLVWADNGRLVFDRTEPSITFACYGEDAHAILSLSHTDEQLFWQRHADRTNGTRRDLGQLLEMLEDAHNWQAQTLGHRTVLLPTAEGRLLRIDIDDPVVSELRLEGDERNWDWATVAVLGDRLVTARSGDEMLRCWDLTTEQHYSAS